MSGDAHVRICESLGVQFPRATRLMIVIRRKRYWPLTVHLNLAYRWFCRLGFDGRVPDHTAFSRNRHGRFRGGFSVPQNRPGMDIGTFLESLLIADSFEKFRSELRSGVRF